MRFTLALAAVSFVACSHHKEDYVAAKDAYQNDLGDLATYATLLDPTSYGDADPRVVVPSAEEKGVAKICTIATKHVMVSHPKTDVEKQVLAAMRLAEDGCCANASSKQCHDGVAQAQAALAKLDADAVTNGLPAGSLAPSTGRPNVRAEVDAIRAATKPTPEESRLTKLWTDPSGTRATLEAACAAARASDPKKPSCTDAAECVVQARATETSDRCSDLSTYIMLEDMDAVRVGADNAKLCAEAKKAYTNAPPASMTAKRAEIVAKRCP